MTSSDDWLELHRVSFELAGWVTMADLVLDLEHQPNHPLQNRDLIVAHSAAGLTVVSMSVWGADLWTCILAAMTLIRQSGYEPVSVHVAASRTPRAA